MERSAEFIEPVSCIMIPGFRTRLPGSDSFSPKPSVLQRGSAGCDKENLTPAQSCAGSSKGLVNPALGVLYADVLHYEKCAEKGCSRCSYVRNAIKWHQQLPMGQLQQSWLQSCPDAKGGWHLKCSICAQTQQDNEFARGVKRPILGNLKRHHDCEQHQAALAQLGMSSRLSDGSLPAPPADKFGLVFDSQLKGDPPRPGIKACADFGC